MFTFLSPLPVSPNTYGRRANGRAHRHPAPPLSLIAGASKGSPVVGRRASCRALQCLEQTETAPRLSPALTLLTAELLVWFAQSISMLNSSTQPLRHSLVPFAHRSHTEGYQRQQSFLGRDQQPNEELRSGCSGAWSVPFPDEIRCRVQGGDPTPESNLSCAMQNVP